MSQLFYYIKQETLGEHNPSTGQRTLWALFTFKETVLHFFVSCFYCSLYTLRSLLDSSVTGICLDYKSTM